MFFVITNRDYTKISIKKTYFIFAFCVVFLIAIVYAIDPPLFAQTFLDMPDLSINFSHILRAIMGLYIILGFFWLYAAFRSEYRNMAIFTTVVFAGDLVVGRFLSFALDGWPSPILVFYAILELGLVPIALWVLRRAD